MTRSILATLATTSWIALAAPVLVTPAFAQTAAADTGATARPLETADSGDIVVTATKREERLRDVPISVSVVGGEQLAKQNVNEVVDLVRNVPSLNIASPFGALSIRGVGTLSFSRSSEGSVGIIVDGVALANTSTSPPQLFDVARVEVLEGPQGTLFGRNSSAGVINIVTAAPDPSKLEVIGHADIATRNNYIGRAVVNIPVAANAALRVAGSYSQAPENQYNRFDGTDYRVTGKSVRARFLWDPIDALTFNIIGDYSKFDRKGGVPWSVYQSTPGSLLSQRLATCGVVVGPENQQGCTDGGNHTNAQSYGVSGQVDARIGDFTITSISAYRAATTKGFATDVDNVPVDRLNVNASPTIINNLSQELRLTSPTGGLVDYVAGVYYFDSKLYSQNIQRGMIAADLGVPFVLGQITTTHSSTTSVAAFANATVHIGSALRLIAGVRYGNEAVSASSRSVLAAGAVAPIGAIAPIDGSVSDDYFSYRVGAQFDITHDIMVYGTYTKGYKGPAVNDQSASAVIPLLVRPEIPHASEIGVKAGLFDGRLTASLAVFYNRIDDFQAQFFSPTLAAFIFGNAPKLTTKGVSLNLVGRPMRGLTLNGGVLYNDAKYGNGYLVACAQGQTAAQGCQTVGATTVDDAGGNRLAGAPKWKAAGFAEYATPIAGSIEGFAQADVAYTSRITFDAAYSPQNANAPAAIFGGRIGVRTDDQRYGVSVFARNLFDTYRSIVRFATPTARQQRDLLSFSQVSGPESRRTVGVSLDARF